MRGRPFSGGRTRRGKTQEPWAEGTVAQRPLRPCRTPGCPHLTRQGAYCSHCAAHAEADDRARRGSAAQRGYGYRWRKLRDMQLAREPLCASCGAPASEVDHITPKARGGRDTRANLQSLCKTCHSRKTLIENAIGR